MKHASLWVLLCAFGTSTVSATEAVPILPINEPNNAAAGYVGTMNYYIGAMANACRPVLAKPEGFAKEVVARWRSMGDNERLFRGAMGYLAASMQHLEQTQGADVAASYASAAREAAMRYGGGQVDEQVAGSPEQKQAACRRFLAHVEDGSYTISRDSEHYPALQRMAELTSTSRPHL